ncbi:hypothetical protein J6590_103772 [Homalodisca vitripennis]|nr:hypothetical protein J6590_103772 [Homalodisca vitripennis]
MFLLSPGSGAAHPRVDVASGAVADSSGAVRGSAVAQREANDLIKSTTRLLIAATEGPNHLGGALALRLFKATVYRLEPSTSVYRLEPSTSAMSSLGRTSGPLIICTLSQYLSLEP